MVMALKVGFEFVGTPRVLSAAVAHHVFCHVAVEKYLSGSMVVGGQETTLGNMGDRILVVDHSEKSVECL